MGKRKHLLIAAIVMLLAWCGALQVHAAGNRCPQCGGSGGTVITIHQTVRNPNGTSFVVPRQQKIPCGACGGTGYLRSVSSGSSSTGSGNSSSSNSAIGKKVKNGTVIAATDGIGDYEDGHNLLDGNKKSKFNVKATKAFIIWEAPKKIRVNGYVITTANDTATYTGRNPKSWVLYGSNKKLSRNAKGWKKIHSVKNDKKLKPVNFKSYTYKLKKKAKAYRYYKLEITANQGADCTQLSEFKLKGK